MKASKLLMMCLLVLMFSFSCTFTNAQREDNIWILGEQLSGHNFKIDFSNGQPDTISIINPLIFFLANASICDTNGQLSFYTNGINIFNNNYDTLLNSTGFNPGWATNYYAASGMGIPQSLIIVPSSADKYYLFHMSAEPLPNGETQPLNLSYSVIDMNLDNGLGGLSIKNKHIIDDTLTFGKLAACRHANGRDWWIVTHFYDNNEYLKILCTPDTIFVASQQIGSVVPFNSDITGQIVFSPDGSKLVYALQNSTLGIDIFNFDRCNGILSLLETVIASDTSLGITGCAISHNSRYLYVNNNNKLFQYDLYASNIRNSEILIDEWDTLFSPSATNFFFEQLGPDERIYMSTYGGSDKLHVINNPDQPGTTCNFVQNQITLPSYTLCLPNFPNYRLGSEPGSICDSLHIGIEDILQSSKAIHVFPNPASTETEIEYSIQNKSLLWLIDNWGRIVLERTLDPGENRIRLNVTSLKAGFYSIRIEEEDNMHFTPLVIIR